MEPFSPQVVLQPLAGKLKEQKERFDWVMEASRFFGYRVALPAALHFLTNYDNSIYNVQIRAADFISFSVLVLAACGAVFELPIVVLGLVRVGALTSKKLRSNRRIGYMIVAAIGVALPGVDPVTTIVETIPLAILFEASIWLSVFFERRWFAPLAAAEGI